MRCFVGVVMFVVLYFGSCRLLGEIAGAMALRNDPGLSRRASYLIGQNVVHKYHALVAVGVGVITIVGCSLPTLLVRMSEKCELHKYAEEMDRC